MSPMLRLGARILRTVDKRLLWKFVWNFGLKGMLSVERFKRRLKRGEYFPPFLYLSIVNSCNLRCQGCWVDVESPREMIDIDDLNRLVSDAKEHGNSFFGVLGGEPFLHPQLFDFLGAHPDCYFQIFTNGQMITREGGRKATAVWATSRRSSASRDARSQRRAPRQQGRAQSHPARASNCIEAKLLPVWPPAFARQTSTNCSPKSG